MRIGKWVPIYKRLLPIPRRLSMAFGLFEGSQLYLSRLEDEHTDRKYGCEVIVSPVPFGSWRSAARLSVRIKDKPHALTVATAFLRQKQMNIIVSECCSTYQDRAHWDAICDIARVAGFDHLKDIHRDGYDDAMRKLLGVVEARFREFANEPDNSWAFLHATDFDIQLSPLTGLNDVSFSCNTATAVDHRGGAVEIDEDLAREIRGRCQTDVLPHYALITGNTEQRYMRVLFLRDYDQLFHATVHDKVEGFAAGGVGVLNQLLAALSPQVNLIRASTYIVEKNDKFERGRIELLGHWELPSVQDTNAKRSYMESELAATVRNLEIVDVEGVKHQNVLELGEFATPRDYHPRIFVSYSTSYAKEKLEELERALLASGFEPVRGTDMGQPSAETFFGAHAVTPDVVHTAFQAIHGCVAFISLQVPRDDYEVAPRRGASYVLPPWAIAEEVYAWSINIPLIIRLKADGVELPPYNQHVPTLKFSDVVDQLDLAARKLETREPLHARLALILTDNVVELILHQQCVEAAEQDRLYGNLRHLHHLPHLRDVRLEPRQRSEILGRYFAPKLSFCKQKRQLSDDDAELIRVGHDIRNELYHAGRRRDDIIYPIAWHYHELACKVFGRLRLETQLWNTDDTVSDAVTRHATASPWRLNDAFITAAGSLSSSKPHPPPSLAKSLADSLLERLEVVEQHFGWIVRDNETQAIIDAEFSDHVYGEDSPVWAQIRDVLDLSERERLIAELRSRWSPKYGKNRIPGWRRRSVALSSLASSGIALARFWQLESEIEPFERFVLGAANAAIDAIEMEVDIRRGK